MCKSSLRNILTLGTLLAALGGPHAAQAQTYDADVRLDQLQPPSPGSPFSRAEGTFDSFNDSVAFGGRLTFDYANNPLKSTVINGDAATDPNFDSFAEERALVEHMLLVHVGASLTPVDWLHFELNMPFVLFATGVGGDRRLDLPGQVEPTVAAVKSPGLGDIRVGAFVRPYESRGFDFTIGGRFWAPLGSRESYMRGPERNFRAELTTAVAGEASGFLYGCTLGIAPTIFGGRDGDRAALSCAAHFKLAPMLSAGIEPHAAAFSFTTSDDKKDEKPFPGLSFDKLAFQVEPLAAVSFQWEGLSATLAGGPGFGGAPGTAGIRGMLSVSYTSSSEQEKIEVGPADRDLDGVVDDFDACPDEAGPKSQSGCPSQRDEDGDGITEGDACPAQAGAAYEDPAANGCPDSDNDRLPDPLDPCPKEPGDESDGCPRYARVKDNKFVVKPPLAFTQGMASLETKSKAGMLEIIATLRANSDFKQLSVIVGTKGAPEQLTDQRAQQLLHLFDDQNIDSSRFEVVLGDELASGKVEVKIIR